VGWWPAGTLRAVDEVAAALERDNFMTVDQALAWA
jgi:hypothetical protein